MNLVDRLIDAVCKTEGLTREEFDARSAEWNAQREAQEKADREARAQWQEEFEKTGYYRYEVLPKLRSAWSSDADRHSRD